MEEAARFLLGATIGLGVVFAALAASTASIRAGQSWDSTHRLRATAFAAFAGFAGAAALAGIVYGIFLVVWHSPFAG